jgi:AraC family transcriptional regulator
MEPRIEQIGQKKLVGMKISMSHAENKTFMLWKSFMPHRGAIKNKLNKEFISMQVYQEPIRLGDLNQEFEKWAAVEVSDYAELAAEMETYSLEGGLYAIFHYKGTSTDNSIFVYIFGTWLPNSGYLLDERPHFEVLGEKYKNGDPNSEEDIYIPIKPK